MGRLWDDHFRHLGYPPKFYRVQDAICIDDSSSRYHINDTLMKSHWEIIKFQVLSENGQKTKKVPGMHHTEVRSGDAPKPPFSIKQMNWKKPKIRIRSTIPISESAKLEGNSGLECL